jgi:hypothetical protein
MTFTYGGNDPGLAAAATFASELVRLDDFWQAVAALPPFTYTELSPADIAGRLRAVTSDIRVQHFYSRRSTVAATRWQNPFCIFYNTKYIASSVAEKTNTLIHELVHNVDWFGDGTSELEYTHPTRPTDGRPRSAPYAIGKLAEERWLAAHGPLGLKSAGAELSVADALDCDLSDLRDDEIMWVTP